MKLWEPKDCCCCFDRRNGSLIVGILYLISGCSGLLLGIAICSQIGQIPTKPMKNVLIGEGVFSLVLGIMQITFSSLLIHGIVKKKTRFLIPMMITYLVELVATLLLAGIVIGVFMYLQEWVIAVVLIVVFGLVMFLKTYFLLVIRAHYFDMKRLKGQIHMSLNDQENYEVTYDSKPPPYENENVKTMII